VTLQVREAVKGTGFSPYIEVRTSTWVLQTAEEGPRQVRLRGDHPGGAKQAAEKGLMAGELPKKYAAGAKAHIDFAALAARLKSCPVTKHSQILLGVSFSAACKAQLLFVSVLRHPSTPLRAGY
jgi:hypothetical protein